MRIKLVTILLVCMTLTACQPAEMSARDAIAGAKGSLDKAASVHPECTPTSVTPAVCDLINRGNAAKHTAGAALKVYCSGDQFDAGTGPCQPPTDPNAKAQAAAKLKTAIQELQGIVDSLKKVIG